MKLNQTKQIKSRAWVTALAGLLSLTVASVSQAAFMPVPITSTELGSPVLLGAGTLAAGNAVGTVVAFNSATWTVGAATGSLRSMVVNNGGSADYYLQLKNDSAPAAFNDVFRMVLNGLPSQAVTATYFTTSPLATLTTTAIPAGVLAAWAPGTTNKGAIDGKVFEADQSPLQGAGGSTIGFDFDPSQFVDTTPGAPTSAPQNIDGGQISNWLVVRTSNPVPASGSLGAITVEIDGGFGSTFNTPIPEPTTVAFGLALTGVCLGRGFKAMRGARKQA